MMIMILSFVVPNFYYCLSRIFLNLIGHWIIQFIHIIIIIISTTTRVEQENTIPPRATTTPLPSKCLLCMYGAFELRLVSSRYISYLKSNKKLPSKNQKWVTNTKLNSPYLSFRTMAPSPIYQWSADILYSGRHQSLVSTKYLYEGFNAYSPKGELL